MVGTLRILQSHGVTSYHHHHLTDCPLGTATRQTHIHKGKGDMMIILVSVVVVVKSESIVCIVFFLIYFKHSMGRRGCSSSKSLRRHVFLCLRHMESPVHIERESCVCVCGGGAGRVSKTSFCFDGTLHPLSIRV